MEVSRLVETLVAYFVRAFAAPILGLLVESFLLPVFVDPPQTWLVTRSALTRLGLLAIVRAQQAATPMKGWQFVALVQVLAGFFPWTREAAGLDAECSFSAVCYPVEEEEKRILGVRSRMRRESVVA